VVSVAIRLAAAIPFYILSTYEIFGSNPSARCAGVEQMNALVSFLTENCCGLADEECDANGKPVAPASGSRKRA
jgi:hypothetical protein